MSYQGVEILPAVLAKTEADYKDALTVFSKFTNRIHLDIIDGLAPEPTIGLDKVWWPKGWQVDIHMMVDQPSKYLERLLTIKPRMVLFHAGLEADLLPIFSQLKQAGIMAGLVLTPDIVPKSVAELIKAADHVLIFAGHLGQMGGRADLLQTGKARIIKKINPEVTLGWDGGANINNLYSIVRAGITTINVGSAISKANDPKSAYQSLVDLVSGDTIV